MHDGGKATLRPGGAGNISTRKSRTEGNDQRDKTTKEREAENGDEADDAMMNWMERYISTANSRLFIRSQLHNFNNPADLFPFWDRKQRKTGVES